MSGKHTKPVGQFSAGGVFGIARITGGFRDTQAVRSIVIGTGARFGHDAPQPTDDAIAARISGIAIIEIEQQFFACTDAPFQCFVVSLVAPFHPCQLASGFVKLRIRHCFGAISICRIDASIGGSI
jgi:hypothetical protein